MRFFKLLLWAALALVVFVCAIGFFHHSSWRVEKSLSMRAKPAAIYSQIATPERWQEWMSWGRKKDPPALTLSGGDAQKGVAYVLAIAEEDLEAHGSLAFTPEGDATRVIWIETGDVGWNPVTRLTVGVLESARGRLIDKGLGALQAKVEGGK
jgi:hypothetical protein